MDHAKVTEMLGKIAPGNSDARAIEHRLDKPAVILGRHSHIPHPAWKKGLMRAH